MKKFCPTCKEIVDVDPHKEICPKCGTHIPIPPHEKEIAPPPPPHPAPPEIREINEKLDIIIQRLPPPPDPKERPPHELILDRLSRIESKIDKLLEKMGE